MKFHVRAAILLVAALVLAAPALADPIDDAKRAGHIGEQADGYLGLAPGGPASAKELIESINAGRRAKYSEIAAKNVTSATKVAALAGKKLSERTEAGEWVRDAEGNWTQK